MNDIITDCNMPFTEYLSRSEAYLRSRRPCHPDQSSFETIIAANSPFELQPVQQTRSPKIGLLFIHGLFDSPFTMRELAVRFANQNMLCRSILLPGHGTKADDLMHITYHEWLNTMRYAIQSLSNVTEKIVLVGYSTGAILSLYHALNHQNIAGLILIAPAIQIKFPTNYLITGLSYVTQHNKPTWWLKKEVEIDYTKYRSIPFNAVYQLTELVKECALSTPLACPMYMVASKNDETISTSAAIQLFRQNTHEKSRLLLYSTTPSQQADSRILERNAYFPEQSIDHFSHRSLLFSATNPHYGTAGDYPRASHPMSGIRYGAYVGILGQYYHLLHHLHLTSEIRQELTYNPDFDFLSQMLIEFVQTGL